MSIFEVIEEYGNTAVLQAKERLLPPTPWLLGVEEGLMLAHVNFNQIILTESGIQTNDQPDNWKIPQFSFITPMLTPIAKNLEKSIRYELNLFLDRLDMCELPSCFGLVYNPLNYEADYLEDILAYNPSIIALQFDNINRLSMKLLIPIIISMREKIPRNIAIYIPGGASIGYQTLLIALGVDILDETIAYTKAANDILLDDGFEKKITSGNKFAITVKTNLQEIRRDFYGICKAVNDNTLWTRLAREMHSSPKIASGVTMFNHEFISLLNLYKFPQTRSNQLNFTGDEGLYHPEVVAFRKRVIERYSAKNDTRIVLLLPCSAAKPYRNSRSHNIFENGIGKALKHRRRAVEVWSLTSPLGVVPRPIETVYPAAFYDIPVTGHWSVEENEITGGMLDTMLSALDNNVIIIAHVSSDYRGMISVASKNHSIVTSWIDDKPTSSTAIDNLISVLQKSMEGVEMDHKREKALVKQAKRDIPGLVLYMHGERCLFDVDDINLVGRPPRPIQVQKNRKHFITWDQLLGEIRLSPEAALEIANKTNNWILLDTDKLHGSSIYGAGIHLASATISPGDEVLFFNKNKSKLIGIGNAIISGDTMNDVNYGRVASIRKKCALEVKK